jgi:isopenicillin N synthase-like dioxygenase
MSAEQAATVQDGYVPVIDMGLTRPPSPAGHTAAARSIASAYRSSGFFVAVGHGVPGQTVTAMHTVAGRFFRQDRAVKDQVRSDPLDPLQRGYTPGDRLEMFSANPLGEPAASGHPLFVPNRWPDLPGFRDAYLAYQAAVESVGQAIMRLCALALGLPKDWFDAKFGAHMSPLTANYYPARPEVGPDARLRNEPHSDLNVLTLLSQDDSPGGLQVQGRGGRWADVPPVPGSFVVNLGQLMTIWTNDQWQSTVHRVVNPPPEHRHRDRISIAFFYQPGPDTIIECIPTCATTGQPARHPPVTAGQYLVAKVRRAYLRQHTQSGSRG